MTKKLEAYVEAYVEACFWPNELSVGRLNRPPAPFWTTRNTQSLRTDVCLSLPSAIRQDSQEGNQREPERPPKRPPE